MSVPGRTKIPTSASHSACASIDAISKEYNSMTIGLQYF
jgi:hypothetical protein